MPQLEVAYMPFSHAIAGPPKPIEMNHGTFSVADKDRFLPAPPGRKNQNWALWNFASGGAFLSSFPAFHVGLQLQPLCGCRIANDDFIAGWLFVNGAGSNILYQCYYGA